MFGYSIVFIILQKYKTLRAYLPRLAEQRWCQRRAFRAGDHELAELGRGEACKEVRCGLKSIRDDTVNDKFWKPLLHWARVSRGQGLRLTLPVPWVGY